MNEEKIKSSLATSGKMPALTLALLLTLFTACSRLGGGDDAATAQFVNGASAQLAAGAAKLSCSQECANMAACGVTNDRGTVVLLSVFAPSTELHNFSYAIPVDTQVQIIESRNEPMRRMIDNYPFSLNFYRVSLAERTEPAWVAGFCIDGSPSGG